MTMMTSEREYLMKLFAKAGRPDGRYRTDEEQLEYLSQNGAQRFKRRALGLCGHSTIKTLDEMATLLLETGIASTQHEARQLVPEIADANKIDTHAINRGGLFYMAIDVVGNGVDERYKVTAWEAD